MALTPETGAIVTNADSYNSVAQIDTYNTDYVANATWTAATTADKERHARLATQFIDAKLARRFLGVRTESQDTQSLEWPRTGAITTSGYAIDDDEMPEQLTRGHAELAIQSLAGNVLMSNYESAADNSALTKKFTKIGGAITSLKEWAGAQDVQNAFPLAMQLLYQLTTGGGCPVERG
jgi:hypothetical protein